MCVCAALCQRHSVHRLVLFFSMRPRTKRKQRAPLLKLDLFSQLVIICLFTTEKSSGTGCDVLIERPKKKKSPSCKLREASPHPGAPVATPVVQTHTHTRLPYAARLLICKQQKPFCSFISHSSLTFAYAVFCSLTVFNFQPLKLRQNGKAASGAVYL